MYPAWLGKYKRLRRVKALHPHVITYANGKKLRVTREKLLATRDKMNKRAQAGTLATASTDHIITIDEKGNQRHKPSSQIELLGYEAVWDYAKMKDGREWLYCDVFVDPSKYDKAKGLPFTSVEYHPDEDVISNMALTKHKPVLDVDTITPYHWERGEVNSQGTPVPLVAYSVETRQGPVVIYSTERAPMNPLAIFAKQMSEAAQALLTSAEADPGTDPIESTPGGAVVPFSGSAHTGQLHPDTLKLRAIERRAALEALKGAGRNIDVDKEMQAWSDMPEEAFQIHLKFAAACYSTGSSGGAKVDPIDGGNWNGEAAIASRAKAAMQARVKNGLDYMNYHQCLERCKSDPSWDGSK